MALLIDLVNEAVSGATFFASSTTTTTNGTGVDLANGEISTNAVLDVGTVAAAGSTLTVTFQESNDNGVSDAFANIAGTPTMNAVTTSNTRQVLRFLRTKRYCRAVATFTGTNTTTTFSVELFAQKKFSNAASASTQQQGGVDRYPST